MRKKLEKKWKPKNPPNLRHYESVHIPSTRVVNHYILGSNGERKIFEISKLVDLTHEEVAEKAERERLAAIVRRLAVDPEAEFSEQVHKPVRRLSGEGNQMSLSSQSGTESEWSEMEEEQTLRTKRKEVHFKNRRL